MIKLHRRSPIRIEETLDHFPIIEIPNERTNYAYYTLIDPEEVTAGCIDLTERVPKRLSRGNEYIMVAYHFNTNYIRNKNRRGAIIIEA